VSMYKIAVGDGHEDERGAYFLAMLGNPPAARFRDAWAEKHPGGELVIVIYTRTGGPNRDGYAAANDALAAHPLYIRDADDTFDPTYASWFFRVPPGRATEVAGIAVDPVDTARRWQDAIDRVTRGEVRPAEIAFMDQLAATFTDPSPDSPRIIRI
jgi:hypothetical protein